MTVPATARRAGPYNGNGSTTSFSFSFKTYAAGDLLVTKMDALGLETTLVLNSDYSVTLNGDQDASPGGSITYPISGSALPSGHKLTIIGDLDYQQTTDLLGGGAFNARVIEDTFDRATIQIQQLEERLDRALLIPVNSTANVQLPDPEGDKVIGWDEDGTKLVNYSPSDLATVVVTGTSYTDVFSGTGAQTVFVLTANPGSVNALDIAIGGVSQVNGVDFTVSGTTLTFTSAPPAGTGNVAVRYVAAVPVGSANSQDVSFLPAGTGAVTRTAQSKLRDVVSVKDFGAVGDGVTDDSAAFTAALAAANSVYLPWGVYRAKNVTIGTHQSVFGNGSIVKAAPSATSIFTLTGFKPYLADCYFDDSDSNITPSLGVNGGVVVVDATYPTVTNCQFLNMHSGLVARVSSVIAANQVTKGTFSNLVFDTIQARGIYVGPNVNSCVFDNAQMYVGQVPSGGKAIPKAGCIGFQIVSTGTNNAAGGHFISQIAVLEAEIGFQFTDAQLTNVTQCIADSLKGSGYQLTNACEYIKFDNCFAGTCANGFEITGTSTNIWIEGCDTIFQGVVPPWGDLANFFQTGPYYDIKIGNTASVRVGTWYADAYSIFQDATTSLTFDIENEVYVGTTAQVAAASTVYLTPAGASANENFNFVAPRKGVLLQLRARNGVAPGAGQSFTYTVRVDAVDTGLQAITSGASSFGSIVTATVPFNAGSDISVKLVTSATASLSQHRAVLRIKYL